MNLHSKKARVPIAALGVTALCTAGLGVLASSAFAAALTATPSASSVTITDLDPSAVTSPVNINALATYGVQVSGVDTTIPLKVVATGPTAATGANLFIQATSTTPTSAGTWVHPASLVTSLVGSTGTTVAATPSATGRYFIGATYPGSYTLKFYQEGSAGSSTVFDGDSIDNALPTMTVNVKDVNGTTATASDDLGLTLTSTPSNILKGERVSSTVTVQDLTTTDVRGVVGSGTYPSAGALGNALIGPLALTYSLNGGAASAGTGLVYNGTTYTNTSNAASAAGSLVTTAALGSSVNQQSTSTVTDNNVATLTYQNPDTANVDFPSVTGGGTATVRAGTSTVTYKVKAVDGGSVVVPNAKVFFRILPLSGGTTATVAGDLTTSAGTPDSDGDVAVNTDDSGIATLTVTTAAKATGNRYSVTPRSNAATLSALNATYATATATSVKDVTNVAALAGGTATITGRVVDQFGESISPAGAAATITNTSGVAFTPSPGTYSINSSGTFSGTVTDGGSATANHTSGFSVTVTGVGTAATGTIAWRTSITPATATFTSITNSAAGTSTLPLASGSTATVDLTDSTGITTEILNGTVKDSGGNGLPYASVTYSGSDGVYFLNSQNQLVTTITAPATSAGALEDLDTGTPGVAVVFTKTGTATITMVAGSATDVATVPTENSTDSWKVVAQDAKSKPGQAITLLGHIYDAFGNPVVGRQVTLSLNTVSAGSLSGTDANGTLAGFQVTTDNQGVWSTPFTSTSNQNGTATLTATLVNAAGNANIASNAALVANAAYANAGLTVPAGEYQDTADIQVVDPTTGIAATARLVGGGKAQLSGTAEAGASVDLYARPSGDSGFTLVKSLNADDDGMWGIGTTLTKTTSFFARSGGKTSDTVTTVVYSSEEVTAKALGHGMVRFSVYGTPNVKGTVNIYYGSSRLAHVTTDSHGDVTVTFKAKTGKRTFMIYFVAPGTSLKGRSLTGTVK